MRGDTWLKRKETTKNRRRMTMKRKMYNKQLTMSYRSSMQLTFI